LEYGGNGSQGSFILAKTLMGAANQTDKPNRFLINQLAEGTQTALTSGSINSWSLTLNDMNQETEYQENKNLREISYVRR